MAIDTATNVDILMETLDRDYGVAAAADEYKACRKLKVNEMTSGIPFAFEFMPQNMTF